MIESNFNFKQSLWRKNIAFIKINDHVYWMDHHNWMHTEGEMTSTETLEEESSWVSPIRIIYKNVNKVPKITMKIGFIHKGEPISPLSEVPHTALLKMENIFSFSDFQVSFK